MKYRVIKRIHTLPVHRSIARRNRSVYRRLFPGFYKLRRR